MARGEVGNGVGQYEPIDVRLLFGKGTTRCQTGFSVRKGAALAATPQDVANHVNTNLMPAFRGIIPVSWQVYGIETLNVIDKTGGSAATTAQAGLLNAADLGPSFMTAVLTLKGEQRSRQGQGRMLLPCLAELHIDGDVINAQGQAAFNAFKQALDDNYLGAEGGQEFVLINHHPALLAGRPTTRPTPLPAVPAMWYDVISTRLNGVVSSLRSRKAGVGS